MNLLNLHWEQLGEILLNKALAILLVSFLFFILYQIVSRIVRRLFKNYSTRKWTDTARILTFGRLTISALHYLTVFLYIYTLLGICGIPVANLLAGAGIFGAALGFAGRDLVTDIINGFFIIIEHQVNVGDTVAFANLEVEGTVKAVGIRSITLIASDGATVFIPNRNITALQNYSYQDRTVQLDIPVTLSNLTEMKSHILKVNQAYPQVKFIGIVPEADQLYLRSSLSAPLSNLTELKQEILDKYYEK